MIYLYDDDGFYLSQVADTIAPHLNSTPTQPDFSKIDDPNWEVKFDKEHGIWTYKDITPPPPDHSTLDIPIVDEEELKKQQEEAHQNYINNLVNDLNEPMLAKLLANPKLTKFIKKLIKDANKSV